MKHLQFFIPGLVALILVPDPGFCRTASGVPGEGIDDSRRSAIVLAAERVSPAVVSVSGSSSGRSPD